MRCSLHDSRLASMDKTSLIFITVVSVFVLLSVCSNMLVILVMYKCRNTKSVTNIFIVNIAISDVILAAIVLPQQIHDISHTNDFYEGQIACKLVHFLPVFCVSISTYSLVILSHERYLAIVQVLKLKSIENLKRTRKNVCILWIVSMVIASPEIYEYTSVHRLTLNETHVTMCGSYNAPRWFQISNAVMLISVVYVIPLITMVINYCRIVVYMMQKRGNGSHVIGNQVNCAINRNKIRVMEMLIVVTFMFALAWAPFFVLLASTKITGRDASTEDSSVENMTKISSAVFSTSYNFIIYLMYNRTFRRVLKETLCGNKIEQTTNRIRVVSSASGMAMPRMRSDGNN
uniref:Probable G-protein coupled receptor 19-like n=1 Tax=Saccoglossus kowalevskii TaxID=10224 RepID=A0ABM0GM00_SACKO|nr:PREDICTED: probable G-protein coupled receptor 19-like [Saccoglossus kowalevskii]